MPYEAIMAQLWMRWGGDPDDYDDWPMDRVFRYQWYAATAAQIDRELAGRN